MRKVTFHPFFTRKDIIGFALKLTILAMLVFFYPNILLDPDNFIPANALVTPTHIQPEWYFLFAYSVLRSVPNKFGGVLAMLIAILGFLFLSANSSRISQGHLFNPGWKINFAFFLICLSLLTWLGIKIADWPYNLLGILTTVTYFLNMLAAFFVGVKSS